MLSSFSDILNGELPDQQTVDVIGFVTKRETIHTYVVDDEEKEMITIELRDSDGKRLRCSFFDEYPRIVNTLLTTPVETYYPTLIIQFGKVKEYEGEYSITNAFNGTKFHYHTPLPETIALCKRLRATGVQIPPMTQTHVVPFYVDVDYLTRVFIGLKVIHLSDLCTHIQGSKFQSECFAIYATINSLHYEKGWYYTSCRWCNRGARPVDEMGSSSAARSTSICETCWLKPASLSPRFRIEITAVNDSGSAVLVLSDGQVRQLLKVSCHQLLRRLPPTTVFPKELGLLLGMKLLFRIDVTKYNQIHNQKVYTVKEVTNDADFIKSFIQLQ